ncbi:MAG TPA: DMT family transporter [Bacteroidales bacterium]|nr:DMT family transporter [Bacteroidales bacterium]HPS62359.1 DMT family transporter [Bacteroidales bacterium]
MKRFPVPTYVYPLAAMLFWGLSFIWSSVLLQSYQPVTIIFARLVISSAFLFGVIRLSGNRQRIAREDLRLFLFSSLFNPFLYFLCENYGLKYSSPTISAVIIATIPVFSPLVGYITFREKLTMLNIAGIGISFGGVILMLFTGSLSPAASPIGILFLFGAVFSSLFYSVALRKLTERYSALMIVAVQNFFGIFLFLPFFLIFEASSAVSVPLVAKNITALLLLAILASSMAFVLFAHSVKLLGISKSNIFSNLIPVFTAIFSYLLIDESFSLRKIGGIALVIAGVYLSERTRKKG